MVLQKSIRARGKVIIFRFSYFLSRTRMLEISTLELEISTFYVEISSYESRKSVEWVYGDLWSYPSGGYCVQGLLKGTLHFHHRWQQSSL